MVKVLYVVIIMQAAFELIYERNIALKVWIIQKKKVK